MSNKTGYSSSSIYLPKDIQVGVSKGGTVAPITVLKGIQKEFGTDVDTFNQGVKNKRKWMMCSICKKWIYRTNIKAHMRGTITIEGKRICPTLRERVPINNTRKENYKKQKQFELQQALKELDEVEGRD